MRFILFCLGIWLCFPALAGSRTGYKLVFVDLSKNPSAEASKLITEYFNADLPSSNYRCEDSNRFIEFDVVYVRQRPKKITKKLIVASLDLDKKALNELRLSLRSFKAPEVEQGFDGLVVLNNEENHFELTTIGAIHDGYIKKATVASQGVLTTQNLKKLFCESLSRLEYAYAGK